MEFGILGPLSVTRDGETVAVAGRKQRLLLAALLVHHGRVLSVDWLADLLWPDSPPADPRNALQSQVSQLRRALGDEGRSLLVSRPPGYVLEVGAERIDAALFERLIGDGRRAAAAGELDTAARDLTSGLALWRGPALGEFDAPELRVAGSRLEELRLGALEDRFEVQLARGAASDLVPELERLLAEEPLRERLSGQLMLALYRAGRQGEALEVYHRTRQVLADELGVDPGPELVEVYESLLRHDAGQAAPAVGRAVAPGPGAGGAAVPRRLTSFVGRDEELRRISALLEVTRLLTLTGPGGVGKTRLAAETASRLEEAGPTEVVWFVELAAIDDAQLVADAIAEVVSGADGGAVSGAGAREPMSRVLAAVQGRPTLLVLDNCEHLLAAVAEVVHELLTATEHLRVLCTSRERLAVAGETVWSVPSLPVPETGVVDADELLECGAARLFVERATAAHPTFVLDGQSTAAVAEICRRLDGIPLALELAAARVPTLGVADLAARLDDRFRVLTAGERTAQPRQRTLRGVIEWSWELLDPRERALLRRLAVFAAGARLADAEEVCVGDPVAAGDLLELLASLVDKSMVVADLAASPPRYRMLETMRAYAAHRLEEAGERAEFERRHAAHVLAVASQLVPRLRSHEQLTAMGELDGVLPDVRAALERCHADGDRTVGALLATELGWYWYLRGHRQEGVRWMRAFEPDATVREAALSRLWQLFLAPDHARLPVVDDVGDVLAQAVADLEVGGDPLDRAFAGLLAANLSANLGDHEAFASYLEAGRRAIAECGDEVYAATADFVAGQQLLLVAEFAAAKDHVQAALDGFGRVGDRWGRVQCHIALAGLTELAGEVDQALDHVDSGLDLAAELGLRELEAILYTRRATLAVLAGDQDAATAAVADAARLAAELGWVDLRRQVDLADGLVSLRGGRLDDAERAFRGALDEQELDGAPLVASYVLSRLGTIAELRGEMDEAARRLSKALERAQATGDPRSEALALEGLAAVRAAAGEGRDAALLLGAAAARREGVGLPLPDVEAVDVRRAESLARAELGDEAFAAAVTEGHTLTLDELPVPPEDGESASARHRPARTAAR